MNTLFIVNPVAGKNKTKKLIPLIKEKMDKTNIKYNITLTTRPMEATTIAINALDEGYDVIVAVGGDGTVNEVARGIVEKKRGILGVIPAGTGNDLARSLDLPMDPETVLDLIIKGNHKKIDIGIIGDKSFINVAGIGFDTEVLNSARSIKKYLRGKFAYTFGVVKTLFTYKSKAVKITLDDKEIDREILLVAIGNGKYYGGGMKICPNASIEDGYFDICIVKKLPKLMLLFIFPSVFLGKHIKIKKYVDMYRAKNVNITTQDKIYLNIDGEIKDVRKEISFELNEKSISVIS